MSTTTPLGPVIDTTTAPVSGARVVEPKTPDLMLTNTHHLCPGCGEPLAVRTFLEAIQDLHLVDQAICVLGIGCYTSFGSTIDVDLVQALHGRAHRRRDHAHAPPRVTDPAMRTPRRWRPRVP